ncbi:MAG: hypothetical protein H0U53_00515 [Actinobacteria bacterium]|nr:hypothetical protein [Actinomycetota bacterium]
MLDGAFADASLFEVLVRAALPFLALPAMLLILLLLVDRLGYWDDLEQH